MYKDKIVLCGASAYEHKYYFNEDFSALPQSVQDELHIMCVLYTEEIGGVLTLEFEDVYKRQQLGLHGNGYQYRRYASCGCPSAGDPDIRLPDHLQHFLYQCVS